MYKLGSHFLIVRKADILHVTKAGCAHFDTIGNVRTAFEKCGEKGFTYPEGDCSIYDTNSTKILF